MIINKLLILISALTICSFLDAQTITSFEKPSKKELRKAIDTVLYHTSCNPSDVAKRLKAMSVIQREINNFSSDKWKEYNGLTGKRQISSQEKEGTLLFYKKAADKVLREIKKTKVEHGQIVLWNLYNMGYIIKTPSHTFAIDLIHKHIDRFAPYLDFALVTHRHRDHGSMHEFEAFAAAGLDVYAGHRPATKPENLSWTCIQDGETFQVGNITITGKKVDHYYKGEGLKMVTAYEIDCGHDTGNAIVFHTGDGRNYRQLQPEHPVDFFIFHTSVGLDIQKAIDKIQPEYAVFSHAWELGHGVEKYRWTIDDLLKYSSQISEFSTVRLLLPCWGEKIVYSKR